MSNLLLIIGIVIITILTIVLAAAWYFGGLRISRPHSQKKAEEQASLNAKRGRVQSSGAAQQSASSPEDKPSWWVQLKGKSTAGPWVIGFVIIVALGLALLLGAFPSWETTKSFLSLSPQTVGEWVWKYWLLVLALLGVYAIAVALKFDGKDEKRKKEDEKRKNFLLKLGTWVVIAAFALPVFYWVRDGLLPSPICPNVSHLEDRWCSLNTAWSQYFRGENGTPDGFIPCNSDASLVEGDWTEKNGTVWYRLRARQGEVRVRYRAFDIPSGAHCPVL